jgi:hypothetical protein
MNTQQTNINRNIQNGLRTLFQLITMDNWYYISADAAKVANPILSDLFFISWVILGAFIFRNVFVAVVGTLYNIHNQSIILKRSVKN